MAGVLRRGRADGLCPAARRGHSPSAIDVDGTLLDTTYLHVLAWGRALRDHGVQRPMSAEGLRRGGLRAEEAIVVGDTVWDVEAACGTGLGCVCVTTGGITSC